MQKIDITIIGAGIIGLAVAYELSKSYKDVIVVEKNLSFGQETSSRNSEVIHAGIYYPRDSLKAKTCIEGKRLLYEYCNNNNVNNKKIGKLIVAINDDELKELETLFKKGIENGAGDLTLLDKSDIKRIEPYIKAQAAIYSPSTGILDTHGFMKSLIRWFKDRGIDVAYNTEVIGIDKTTSGFKICVKDNTGEFSFLGRVVINCAGLNSDKIAELSGIKRDDYGIKYCKGDYFRVRGDKAKYISRLVYPVPKKDKAGLGIHATLDLSGSLRLGPDDEYVDKIDYNINEAKKAAFYKSVVQFLPFIEEHDLSSDTSGIRPKLKAPNEEFRDFLVNDETDKGFSGLINLIGIESPGLTASLSIAKTVKGIVDNIYS